MHVCAHGPTPMPKMSDWFADIQYVTTLHAQDVTLVSNTISATICQGKFKYQRFIKTRRPGRGRNIFQVI
jgi:hypothetical protein